MPAKTTGLTGFLVFGSLSAALAVLLGSFGSRYLKSRVSAELLAAYETGVRYHWYHSLGFLIVGVAPAAMGTSRIRVGAGWSMICGTVLFSGSLYLIVATGIESLGVITPVGGILFVAAWVSFALAAVRGGT